MDGDFPSTSTGLTFWLERQRYDRVIEEGRRLLAASPEDPELHRLIAIAHWMENDRRAADRHLREALRLRPDDEASLSLLALVSSSSFGSRASDRHAIQALARDPDSLSAWHALTASSLADDREFSMRCARRMLEIDPRNIAARIFLHAATAADEDAPGWHAAAERWLHEALVIEPDNADLHALLGQHLLTVPKRRKEGAAHLRQAIAAAPLSPQAAAWREALAARRDFFLILLMLPCRICTGVMSALGRSLSRYPLLILLGKFYLIAVLMCLAGLVTWAVFLWPVVWGYRRYVVHGDHLRVRLITSGARRLGWLVPAPAWLRRLIMLAVLVAWWQLLPGIFGLVSRLHPVLHGGNLMVAAIAGLILGGAGLLGWLHFRKARRRKELPAFPPAL